ncbi:caspase domain-containing protein [Oricola sp.]|uniref:caspase family protein n=1 Tax=Oricola sp. TaxID=1979950 RepID=UPI0025DE257B|nr:caspase domain-containing protein [Oricola sp.]MCI5076717.1 caspase family protein [Oricola sp.]
MLVAAIALALGTASSLAADEAWIQVIAKPSLEDATAIGRSYTELFPGAAVYRKTNGLYAVVVEAVDPQYAHQRMDQLKARNRIPRDSFIADETTLSELVWSARGVSWIQIAADRDLEDAISLARRYGATLKDVRVYKKTGPLYVVVTGKGPSPVVEKRLAEMKRSRLVPPDSFRVYAEFLPAMPSWTPDEDADVSVFFAEEEDVSLPPFMGSVDEESRDADADPSIIFEDKGQGTFADDRRKVALVIGIGAYEHAPMLANPRNDANAMAGLLQHLGFEVVSGVDLDKDAMERRIRNFVQKARDADLSLFFYAGHGIQVAGQNYLIPVDAEVADRSAIDFELVNVSKIINYMGGGDRVGVVLLDACRNNPFARSLARSLGVRSSPVQNGLARPETSGGGLLIGFATAPDDVADDGRGMRNSPFTTALLEYLSTPGMEIQRVMTRVKQKVISLTDNRQRPWHNSDLARDVFLVPTPAQ